MSLRDEAEGVLRAWNQYELNRGTSAIIDYDCHPIDGDIQPSGSRLEVYRYLGELARVAAEADNKTLLGRLDANCG